MPKLINPITEVSPLLQHDTAIPIRRFVYVYSIIAAGGGLICGYDTGSISSVITLPIFQDKFFIHGSLAYYQSILLASYLVTSMCGAFFSGFCCDSIGRKKSMLLASCSLIMGISYELLGLNIQTLLLGRLIGGLGTGLMTNVIPLYQTEIAPPDIRGRLISIFSLLGAFGQMVGYFVTSKSSHLTTHWSWRMPWLIQLTICIGFAVAVCFLPYSPRWLIDKGRNLEGLAVLSKLHNLPQEHEVVQRDYLDIKTLIEAEKLSGRDRTYAELFQGLNLKRTLHAFFISIATCFTGNVVISYYSPQIFKNAGLSDVSISLALTGGVGLLSLIFTALSLQWWIDIWGRKVLFFTGSAVSSVCMFTVGLIFHFYASIAPDNSIVVVANPYARYVIILCIYTLSASFAGTWGVSTYVYTAEIFSMRCRAKGLSLTYAISWAGSIVITFCTPFLMAYSVSGVYFFFGICSVMTFVGIVFIFETKGKTLEEIDLMFENNK
ncbi:general substrate transporter [Parasitella parasitica]|nr:general substrate transporter [Parasitella parasitica]